jgi:hypothetical protein
MSGLTGTTGSTSSGVTLPPPSNFESGTVGKCDPYLEVYAPFRATSKQVREITKSAAQAGHKLSKNNRHSNMCISFHVKGVCNTNCGCNSDHVPHNAEETTCLVIWSEAAFRT